MRRKKTVDDSVETVTLTEACERLGMRRADAVEAIKHGRFYFPAVKDHADFLISKRAFNDFLEGKRLKNIRNPYRIIDSNKKSKYSAENTKYMQCPVPIELWEQFTKIWENINKYVLKDTKISKIQLMRIAIEEFVERRPEYLHDLEEEGD